MPTRPWNTDPSPLLPHSVISLLPIMLPASLKVPLFFLFFFTFSLATFSHLLIKDGIFKKEKKRGIKFAVYSISFSRLLNAFGELSAYLSNASLNLFDRH